MQILSAEDSVNCRYLPYLNWAVLVYFGLCILSIFVQDIKQRITTQSLGNVLEPWEFMRKSNVLLTENTVDSISCGNQYKSNKCGTDQRAPMLDRECQTWEICMKADPYVDQSKIFVLYVSELLGDFFEGFLGRLSPKAFVGLPNCCSFTSLICF